MTTNYEERIRTLESSLRLNQRIMVAIGLLAAILGTAAASTPRDPFQGSEKMSVKELEIRDGSRSSAIIRLWADSTGSHLLMQSPGTDDEITINLPIPGQDRVQVGSITLSGSTGETVINPGHLAGESNEHPAWFLGQREDRPICIVFDSTGKPKTLLGTLPNGDGEVLVRGNEGRTNSLLPTSK